MALVYPATGGGGTGGGTVTSVTAADTSVVVGGTAADPTVRTATLDVIAADHPAAADWSNNAKKITGLAAASAATDAASLANTLNQFGAPAADVAFNAKKITGLANGSAATDAQAYGQGVASLLTAAGDTVYASAANTLARLAKGSDGQVLTLASGVPSWAASSGITQYDYVEQTTSLTVTATSEATAQAFIDGQAVSYNGTTRIRIEFWIGSVTVQNGTAVPILVDGSTSLGWLGQIQNGSSTVGIAIPFYGVRFLTPSNASHTFHIKWWKTAGTVVAVTDVGGTGKQLPSWYRITSA